jgi:hypothetical protein
MRSHRNRRRNELALPLHTNFQKAWKPRDLRLILYDSVLENLISQTHGNAHQRFVSAGRFLSDRWALAPALRDAVSPAAMKGCGESASAEGVTDRFTVIWRPQQQMSAG